MHTAVIHLHGLAENGCFALRADDGEGLDGAAASGVERASGVVAEVQPQRRHRRAVCLDKLNTQLLGQLEPTFTAIRDLQRAQFAQAFANLARLADSVWPPNWRDVDGPPHDTLDRILLDEGPCVAWLPPTVILRRLFAAETPQERRKIIGSSWKRVAVAAKSELEKVTAPQLKRYLVFADNAVDAVLAGKHQAATLTSGRRASRRVQITENSGADSPTRS